VLFCNQVILVIHCQKPSGKKDSIDVSRVFRLFTGYVRSILRVSGIDGKKLKPSDGVRILAGSSSFELYYDTQFVFISC
jgi:hypothetical protein